MKALACLLALACVVGCDKSDKTGTSAPPSASTATAAATTAPLATTTANTAAALAQDEADDNEFDLVTDDDEVEQAATTQIHKANYKTELEKLEKEDLKK